MGSPSTLVEIDSGESMRRGIRILVGALLGVVLTAGLLVGVSSVALADATGTGWIGGLVTTSAGQPAAGAVATLYTIDADRQRTVIATATTHSDGKFWLGSQPVGSYYLLITDPTSEDAATWWPTPSGPYQPDPFELTTANIYAQIAMTPGLDISGKAPSRASRSLTSGCAPDPTSPARRPMRPGHTRFAELRRDYTS